MTVSGGQRAFSLGRVAPSGWTATAGRRPKLLGTLAPVPASAGAARSRCAEFAESLGATTDTIDAVRIAVSEAVTNVILYAYPGKRTGMAHVTASVTLADRLQIVVADDGVGIDGPRLNGGAEHGLTIIEKVASEVEVMSSAENGTRIEMTFPLRSPV